VDGAESVRDAKREAERIYPGISRLWVRTGYTKRQARKYRDRIGPNLRCSVCRKKWYQVAQMITARKLVICDGCIRRLNALVSSPLSDADSPSDIAPEEDR